MFFSKTEKTATTLEVEKQNYKTETKKNMYFLK